jgi:hypothetical protein
MSDGLRDSTTSIITGAIGASLSLAYIFAARGIEDSLLADAVGASGVPVAVGALMAATSFVLLIKGLLSATNERGTDRRLQQVSEEADATKDSPWRPHLLATGLIGILAIYLVVLPWLGYIVSVGLLAVAVAWFSGGREVKSLLGFAVLTGPLLWFFFDFALKIRMPAGFWPVLFSG